jgi:hypothetical protein
MQENFDKIMEFVFRWEGWHSDDPDDAGGRTVWGITERDYPEEFPALWDMDREEAKARAKVIFRMDYWDKVGGDGLPTKTDAVVMDTAVNMGITFANKLKGYDMMTAIIERIKRYTEISAVGNNIKFLRGWIRRVIDLYYFIKLNI